MAKGEFETFDSAAGIYQKGADMEHRDSKDGLKAEAESSEDLAVPEVPQVKR